ncbi:gas vesicle protein GvpJ [Haloarcula amylovorans]|uniref:gas vesicle protein GvpJ n=1 Tax=Haloarcula amylovorans TaxID=2562280 RepID=UPI001076B2FC|nr:gas vesicle protein [Halomicroarcula amylolytica]
MPSAGPTRSSADLADVVELLLDKGLVINADIAVSVGDTELLGIQIRAAVASFETAAQYGLEFPEGTDQERIEQVANQGRLGPPSDTSDDDAPERPKVSPGSHPKKIQVAQSGGGSPGGPSEESDDQNTTEDADDSTDESEESADTGDEQTDDANDEAATAETEGENDDD